MTLYLCSGVDGRAAPRRTATKMSRRLLEAIFTHATKKNLEKKDFDVLESGNMMATTFTQHKKRRVGKKRLKIGFICGKEDGDLVVAPAIPAECAMST